jgi:hypothetical protein
MPEQEPEATDGFETMIKNQQNGDLKKVLQSMKFMDEPTVAK